MNKPVKAEVVFTNPLNQVVSDIVVTAEGSGLLRDPITVKYAKYFPFLIYSHFLYGYVFTFFLFKPKVDHNCYNLIAPSFLDLLTTM